MALSLNEKKDLVANVSQKIAESNALVLIKYHAIDVEVLNQLRNKARAEELSLRVVPNRLLQRALDGTKFEGLKGQCKGQLITMFAGENASTGARMLIDFAKNQDKIEVVSFSVEGLVYSGKDLKILASMPTRHEAITKVAVLMKMPMTKFARALNDVPSRLVRVFGAVKDKK